MAVWGNLGPVRVISFELEHVVVRVGSEGPYVDVPFSVIEVGEDREGLKVEPWFSRKVKDAL